MSGDAELWMPPSLLLQICDRFPGSEVTIVRDAGHAIQRERPETFNARVLHLIDRKGKRQVDSQGGVTAGAQARSLFTACMMKDERVPRTPGMRSRALRAKSLNAARSGVCTISRKSMSPVTA